MFFLKCKNNEPVKIDKIPIINFNEFKIEVLQKIKLGFRVINFFAVDELKNFKIYIVLSDDKNSELLISSFIVGANKCFLSFTPKIPSLNLFEREIFEDFGITPLCHPWLKPVRYSKNTYTKKQEIKDYPFFEITGEDIHEVAVGPIHAGIIGPGHFRFMCNGEKIYHLEIQLGYQYRGIENLFVENELSKNIYLAESIAGDTVIGHTLSYVNTIEALLHIKVSNKAKLIREIALEMERIAIHIGDLGAISNDVAYLMGSTYFANIRTEVINTMLAICGSRFGRTLFKVGGVSNEIDVALINNRLSYVLEAVKITADTMLSSPRVLSRLEKAGTISEKAASELGLVGMAARASGLTNDARIDHPIGFYDYKTLSTEYPKIGDVYSRTYLRYHEIIESIKVIKALLKIYSDYKSENILESSNLNLSPDCFIVSVVEGWRGEIVHTAITNSAGKIIKYKIKDPSFNNWMGLAMVCRNNMISDFPLFNKSFNLSYSGFDL